MRKAAYVLLYLATGLTAAQAIKHLASPGMSLGRSNLAQLETAIRPEGGVTHSSVDRSRMGELAPLARPDAKRDEAPQAQRSATATPEIPDWALPGSATHKQVPPPADFHRPSRTVDTRIGIFDGQSDVGGALVPGSASYDASTRQYTLHSAGYNIWYQRDEFRFLWKKMSGDFSLAANASFPAPKTPEYDRKVVLIVRQDLEDDAKEVMTGEHATGMVHLAERAAKGDMIGDMQYRIGGTLLPSARPKRIGLQKRGDRFALFISVEGEPMHQFGPPIDLHLDGPYYVGVGFCSHYPATVDTGVLTDVSLENSAGLF